MAHKTARGVGGSKSESPKPSTLSHTHTQIHTHMQVGSCIQWHMQRDWQVPAQIHTIITSITTYTHTNTNIYIYIYTHTHVHTRTVNTYTCTTHTHTHTHTLSLTHSLTNTGDLIRGQLIATLTIALSCSIHHLTAIRTCRAAVYQLFTRVTLCNKHRRVCYWTII